MDWDEPVRPQDKLFEPLTLDRLSVGELNDYIADLETEIARVKAHLSGQAAHRDQAAKLFRD